MKNLKFLFTVVLLGLYACDISQTDDADIEDPQLKNEVRSLLEGKLFTPLDKLKSSDIFQSDENGIHFRNHFFYDQNDVLTISLGIYQGGHQGNPWFSPGDTTGATTYHYHSGKLIQEKSFDYKNGVFVQVDDKNYVYDKQNKLFQILNSRKEPVVTHHYNDKGLLQFKKYGINQDRELDEFFYNDQDQQIKHIYWGGNTPIFEHFYRYDSNGRLVAKETWSGPNKKEDVFQYFYNEKDQLVKELEFYPQWNFEDRFKRLYTYYSEKEVSGN